MSKPTAEIKLLWSLDSEHPSVFPERAMGNIFNDSEKRFKDGEEIITSRILNYDTHREDGFLETRNTVYKIIK